MRIDPRPGGFVVEPPSQFIVGEMFQSFGALMQAIFRESAGRH